jgi:putative SOS response-associated peptidase YedK
MDRAMDRGMVRSTRLGQMCGRFTQQRPTSEIARIFEAEDLAGDPGERYNIAPTDEAAVVVQREDRRAVVRYRWGLVPAWADDPKIASRAFNARAETVGTSPLFRDAFRRRRCLVPVDGFYEWLRSGSKRQPMRIHDPADAPLALAGLWTGRQDPESGEWLRTFTIVTTRPNEFMAGIHDRMPVVVPPDAWATWLDPTAHDPGELRALLEPRDDIALDAHLVPMLVNNVRNDGPALIERLEEPPGPARPQGPAESQS